jgi:hypothetical protein
MTQGVGEGYRRLEPGDLEWRERVNDKAPSDWFLYRGTEALGLVRHWGGSLTTEDKRWSSYNVQTKEQRYFPTRRRAKFDLLKQFRRPLSPTPKEDV